MPVLAPGGSGEIVSAMREVLGLTVLERGWLSANQAVFRAADGTPAVVVDTGFSAHAEQTLALVDNALAGEPLGRIVNTHLHSDHCGGNVLLQQTYVCRTAIPAAEAEKVRVWDSAALTFAATGQQCERFSFDATLSPGDELLLGGMSWQALGAPGHDPHSLIFYCAEERILISADALWENGFGVIFPELDGESGFLEQRAGTPVEHLTTAGQAGLAALDLEQLQIQQLLDLLHRIGHRGLAFVQDGRRLGIAAGIHHRLQRAPMLKGNTRRCGQDLSIQ